MSLVSRFSGLCQLLILLSVFHMGPIVAGHKIARRAPQGLGGGKPLKAGERRAQRDGLPDILWNTNVLLAILCDRKKSLRQRDPC